MKAPVQVETPEKFKVKEYPTDINWHFLRDVPSTPEQEEFEKKYNFYSVYRWQKYQTSPTIDTEKDGTLHDTLERSEIIKQKQTRKPRALERIKIINSNVSHYVYKIGNMPPPLLAAIPYPSNLTMESLLAAHNNMRPIDFYNTYNYDCFDEFLDPRSARYNGPIIQQ